MRIFSRSTIEKFGEKHPDTLEFLRTWYRDMRKVTITDSIMMRKCFPTCRPIGNYRVVFKILGNNYRMIVEVNYGEELLRIKFIGTHSEFDRIHAKTVSIY